MLFSLASPETISIIQRYGYISVGMGIGIESMGIPFPGEAILVTAAIYAGTGHISIIGVIIGGAVGAILGDNVGYAIGRFGGFKLLRKYGHKIRIHPRHLEHAEGYFKKHGGKTVFFGRLVSILRAYAAFFAGVHKMQWQKFMFYNAAGGIAWAILFGMLGYILGKNLSLLSSVIHAIGVIGIIAAVVIIGALFMAWRRLLKQV